MKGLLTLFKMQLNVNAGFSALRFRFRKEPDKVPQTLLVIAAITVLVGSLVSLYSLLVGAVYDAAQAAGRPDLVLTMSFLGLQLFLFFTGIFYVIGVFYYSRDMSALIPLPVRPWQVLGSKFAVVMAYEYLMALPVLIPPAVIYGSGQGEGVLYWLKAAVLLLASPAIPLLLASLVALGLMQVLNVGRRRDLLAIVGGFVSLFAIIGFNLLMQGLAGTASEQDIARMLADQTQFVNTASRAFPPAAWATLALAADGLPSALYLLLELAVSAALAGAMLWLANAVYYRSAALTAEAAGSRRPAKKGALAAQRAGGPVKALFLKEMRLLLRTPAYVMNCLGGALLIPVLMPVSVLQGESSTQGLRALILNPANSLYVTLGALAVMMLVCIVNASASTALSREGGTFWVSRTIPVPPTQQVFAKFLAAMAVASAGLVLCAVMFTLVLGMNPFLAALALLLGLLGAIPVTIASMIPDLIRPKLTWTNPYEAVKQNMNVLLAMVAACVVVGVEAAIVALMVLLGTPDWLTYLALAALLLGQSLAGAKALGLASGRYYKIEG